MKNRKLNKKRTLLLLLSIICIFTFIFSAVNIVKWYVDSKKVNAQMKDVSDAIEVSEIEDSDKTEIIEQDDIPKDNPYWDYIKMNLIDVNISELKKKNSDTVGWIQVNGTNINYPFVQTTDNDYYLTKSFNKKKSSAGWVFMDYRNNVENFDKNTIIYAHGRLDNIMFGTLKNILTSGWLKDTNNYIIKLSTESENTLWQVFSVYHMPTTNDYIQVYFGSNEEFFEFGNMLLGRSAHNFNTTINENDKILTLSTCYSKSEKLVMHAKLIKRESK